MSTPTDGQLCFGYPFYGNFEFPWSDEKYNNDIEDWWRKINNFKHNVESPYTEDGNYKPGIDELSPLVTEYWNERRDWMWDNPIPVMLINYCSESYPAYILSSKEFTSYRGFPKKIDPKELIEDTQNCQNVLDSFMRKYSISPQRECGWYLSSYWGA